MSVEHEALCEKGFIEKSLKFKKLDNGNYLITAYEKPTKNKKERTITLEYTQNGINALLTGLMAVSDNLPIN